MKIVESTLPLFVRHPWTLPAFAFLLLIGAWSALIVVAMKSAPQIVEVGTHH